MYYIYHIPGTKIGVSTEPEFRVKAQGYDSYEILEEHTDIHEVSDREQVLQRQYGYPVDSVPYWISLRNRQLGVNVLKGREISNSHKRAISESNARRTGQKASESRLTALRSSMQSEEVKNKISTNRKGKGTQPKSEETKRRMSEAKKLYWRKKKGEQ